MKDDAVRLTTAERRSFGSLLESMERWQSATMAAAGELFSARTDTYERKGKARVAPHGLNARNVTGARV
jgi:hypothetical protein